MEAPESPEVPETTIRTGVEPDAVGDIFGLVNVAETNWTLGRAPGFVADDAASTKLYVPAAEGTPLMVPVPGVRAVPGGKLPDETLNE
jgi:hypothetical protein